jgi:hypothetical protein
MFTHYRQAALLGEDLSIDASLMVQIRQQWAWQLLLDEQISEADRQIEAAGTVVEPTDLEGQREQLLLACLRAHQAGDMTQAVALAEEFASPGAVGTPRQVTRSSLPAFFAGR